MAEMDPQSVRGSVMTSGVSYTEMVTVNVFEQIMVVAVLASSDYASGL